MKQPEIILVTGATGLLGSHLIRQLSNKYAPYQIRALSKSGRTVSGAQSIACDILDVGGLEQAMQGVSMVYHCAAIVSFDPKKKDQLMATNINGTENVVNACLDAGVKKLLHVSSVAAVGNSANNEPASEYTKFNHKQASVYGITKHEAEMRVWRGFAEGLDTVVINPSIILGTANWDSGSTQLFKNVYKEFPYYTKGIHGYVDVQDVVKAMLMLMETNISGEKFILNAVNISFKDLFTFIANAFDKKVPAKEATPFMAEIVWRISYLKAILSGKHPLLTKETARAAMQTAPYDNSKILKALPGFTFTPIEETIARIANELKIKYHLS